MRSEQGKKRLLHTATTATVSISMLLSMAQPAYIFAADLDPASSEAAVLNGAVANPETSDAAPSDDAAAPTSDTTADPETESEPEVGDTSADDSTTEATPAPALAAAAPAAGEVPAAEPVTQTSIWIDNDTDTTYESINAAVAAATDGQTIHVKGDFTDNVAAVQNTVVNKAVTLEIAGNTVMVGSLTDANYTSNPDGTNDGIKIAGTSRLTVVPGATLTMKYFNRALRVQDSAQLADGHYELSHNRNGLDYASKADLAGSAGRDALVVRTTDAPRPLYFNSSPVKNATIYSEAIQNSSGAYPDSSPRWTFDNVSWTQKNEWLYVNKSTILNSDVLYVGPTTFSGANNGITFQDAYTIENSHVTIDGNGRYVRSALISHTFTGPEFESGQHAVIKNSTFDMKNANGFGGYNLAFGFVDVIDSTINVYNAGTAAMGVNYRHYDTSNTGRFSFIGNSVLNTAMKGSGDSVGADPGTTNATVVMGGAYKWYWNADNPSVGNTPVNTEEHGSERLMLLSLKDTSITELSPIDTNGKAYTYPVANPTDDGAKRVWVPAAKVTFKLDNDSASFADGTKDPKVMRTIRGYNLNTVEGTSKPEDPTDANGVKFLGWFYKDAQGTEHVFNYDEKIMTDTEVYAKWDSKQVVYHNGAGTDVLTSVKKSDTSATVLSYDEVVNTKPEFSVPGKTFVSWNTAEDGSGTTYSAGEALTLEGETARADLYAQYEDQHYTVSFSANGGHFTENSIFAKNPDKFDLVKNSEGQIVEARLKNTALYNDELWSLLPDGISHNDLTIANAPAERMGNTQKDTNWYGTSDGKNSVRFEDYSLWGIFNFNGANPEITGDTTYYVGWKESVAAADKISATLNLEADMWGSDAQATTNPEAVYPGDKNLTLTGAVNIAPIKQQIQEVQNQFGSDLSDPENIKLDSLSSTFTAKLTIPAGVSIDPAQVTKDTVQAEGLADLFEVSDVQVDGQVITVTFELKSGFTNFQQLKDAVIVAGVAAPSSSSAPVRRARALEASGDQLRLTISGLSIDANASGDLTVTGEVTGNFSSYAQYGDKVKKFDFTWNTSQSDAGKNEAAVGLSYTWRTPTAMNFDIPGDILINGDTEHDHIYYVRPNEVMTYTGTIDMSSVKSQMNAIETLFGESDPYAEISLTRTQSEFVATIVFPDELILPVTVEPVLEDNGTFKISKVEKNGNTLRVVMNLAKDFTTYKDLKVAVASEPDILKLSIPGVKLTEGASREYTTTATVFGTFRSIATKNDTTKLFAFNWNATQSDAGRDAKAPQDNNAITATVGAVVVQPVNYDGILEGDILMGQDTGHTALAQVEPTQKLSFTGHLDTDPIIRQIDAYAESFEGDDKSILTKDVDSTFKATFTVDDNLIMPEQVTAQLTDNSLFEITDTKVEDHTVTVTMKLKKTYEKFVDLKADVDSIKGLDLTLSGFTVPEDASDQAIYTVSGKVSGTFTGSAHISGTAKFQTYNFSWTATQAPEGSDFLLGADPDLSLIQYSLQVKVPEQPQPEEPENKPVEPGETTPSEDTSSTTEEGEKNNLPETSDPAAAGGLIASIMAALGAFGIGASHKNRRR